MEKATKTEKKNDSKKVAVIRVRGDVNLRKSIRDTLTMLNLHKKNYCAVFNDSPSIRGMLQKVKDYITWGEIDADTESMLIKRKLEKTKNKEGKEVAKPFFRLSPPRKGFGRKGIKLPFVIGGALGNRKEKVNDLIKRMI